MLKCFLPSLNKLWEPVQSNLKFKILSKNSFKRWNRIYIFSCCVIFSFCTLYWTKKHELVKNETIVQKRERTSNAANVLDVISFVLILLNLRLVLLFFSGNYSYLHNKLVEILYPRWRIWLVPRYHGGKPGTSQVKNTITPKAGKPLHAWYHTYSN